MDYSQLEKLLKTIQDMDFEEVKNLNKKIKEFSDYRKEQEKSFELYKKWINEITRKIEENNDSFIKKIATDIEIQQKNNEIWKKTTKAWQDENIELYKKWINETLSKYRKDYNELSQETDMMIEQFKLDNENRQKTNLKKFNQIINDKITEIEENNQNFHNEINNQLQKHNKNIIENIDQHKLEISNKLQIYSKNMDTYKWEIKKKLYKAQIIIYILWWLSFLSIVMSIYLCIKFYL